MPEDFEVKDSGARMAFSTGMVRDVEDEKADFTLIFDGPMYDRWAEHLTKGAKKYGPRNWTLAATQDELDRFRRSAARHFRQWLRGERDEDHAAAVFFNLNAAEYVAERLPPADDGGMGSPGPPDAPEVPLPVADHPNTRPVLKIPKIVAGCASPYSHIPHWWGDGSNSKWCGGRRFDRT